MTDPKYKPIIFTAPMVRAILEGRKTQTRRVVKHQPTESGLEWVTACDGDFSAWQDRGLLLDEHSEDGGPCQRICPYGQPGDRLWVRERWRIGAWDENNGRFALDYCDGPRKEWIDVPESTEDYLGEGVFEHYWIQCSDELSKKGILPDLDGQYRWEPGKSPLRWRPAIHMPRWASRITLEATGVRVERLQDISEDDAIEEGIYEDHVIVGANCNGGRHTEVFDYRFFYADDGGGFEDAVDAYKALWNSINGPGAWEKNPWVWVVEFKRVEG